MKNFSGVIDEPVLILYLERKLGAAERAAIEKWYAESDENAALLEQLYVINALGKSTQAASKVDVEAALADFRSRIARNRKTVALRRIRKTVTWLAASAVLIAAGIWAAGTARVFAEPIKIQTGIAERVEVTLHDGTGVWLNACSEITYKTSLLSRIKDIDLNGEAYFNVNKDKEVHLQVRTGGTVTKVMGTKFNIRGNSDESEITITLLEGKVRVSFEEAGRDDVTLSPNQKLVYNTSTLAVSVTNEGDESKNSIEWINGRLLFEQAQFHEIARTLERNYNVEINFTDENVRKERFSCSFSSTDNIYQILSILGLTYKFEYSIDGRNITISERPQE